MSKIRCYVSHSIRGKYGKDATVEQMEVNNQRAIEFGKQIKAKFPTIDFYIPGEHDEFITIAYLQKYLTEKQILKIDCEIISRCNFLINFMPDDYLSEGMKVENTFAAKSGIPVFSVYSDNMNEASIRIINHYLEGLMR